MGYRVIELHQSDAALSRWFCLTCQQEAPQRGTYAPECPAKREHEASPHHLAALATKAAEEEQRRRGPLPQNLLQQRVDARPAPAPGTGAARRAAKRLKQCSGEALATPSSWELPTVDSPCESPVDREFLGRWLVAQMSGGMFEPTTFAGKPLATIHSAPASAKRPQQKMFQADSSAGALRQGFESAAVATKFKDAEAWAPPNMSSRQLPSAEDGQVLAFNWTVGTFDLPEQPHVPSLLQPHVPLLLQPHVQPQAVSHVQPPVEPHVRLEPQSQLQAPVKPEAGPTTCERADARRPPVSREVVMIGGQEYTERLLPDLRLGFAAKVTPLAPVRWWLPSPQRNNINLGVPVSKS